MNEHTLYSWGATGVVGGSAIHVAKGDGVYFVDIHGKRYQDFNSQAMCSNLGHTMPEPVAAAIRDQLKEIPYTYPCYTTTPIKAKLSTLLADIFPGDINTFFYTSGGTESNETALRMAKIMTKRHKVLALSRSYHGATAGSIALTGDLRRWASEPGYPGVIHVMTPYPYNFDWGAADEAELTHRWLQYLSETIAHEGGHNIAAFFVEAVTGTNGILKQPKGLLEGIRAICDQHGIVMVCDEVMNGFGRTGKWFGFEHTTPTVLPDIVTCAKGINGAYLPLGAVAVRDHVAEHFRKNPISIGSTYNSHPATLASSYACLKYMLENKVVEHAAAMEAVMVDEMSKIASKHPSIKQGRAHGMFGVLEINASKKGDWLVGYAGQPHPTLVEFRKALLDKGLFTLIRWDQIYCNPPLITTEKELRRGFQIIDECLPIVDKIVKN